MDDHRREEIAEVGRLCLQLRAAKTDKELIERLRQLRDHLNGMRTLRETPP